MCEPVSMTTMLALAAAGSVMNIAGTAMTAAGQWDDANQSARAMEGNARFAELSAGDARQRGEQEAGRVRMGATAAIGELRAAQGASGVDSSSGTAADLAADIRAVSEQDAQVLRNNAAREAWGYTVEASNLREGARQTRRRGQSQVAGTILGGYSRQLSMATSFMGGGR